jgi:hypothetical protein
VNLIEQLQKEGAAFAQKRVEDMRSLIYFYREKGDLTRHVDYAEMRRNLEPHYPDFFKAWDLLKSAERTMDIETRLLDEAADEIEYKLAERK